MYLGSFGLTRIQAASVLSSSFRSLSERRSIQIPSFPGLKRRLIRFGKLRRQAEDLFCELHSDRVQDGAASLQIFLYGGRLGR